eukprot:TRINITY_DN4989_c0_g1_i1.p1 TRINITY_DN4989_c0_g1~~TRINITY_DN4989_c0_g1_i1.p1  ORF type:complete len:217 (-),score=46.03 TRINITY_DN4989_c0_g1_i1:27-677(-)
MSLFLCGCFYFCLFIVFTQCHDEYAKQVIESDEHLYVTCGSVIKLRSVASGFRLHSHQVTYGTGSGQQSVTGYSGSDDNNSFWVVKGPFGKDCTQGTPIAKNDVFRLEHHATGRNLHSHLHQSPLSKQQEVSCFGEADNGDTGDNWSLKPVNDGDNYWIRGNEFRLQHVDTSKWLQMSTHTFNHPIPGQREIACSTKQGSDTKWTTAEGLFFPHPK